MIHFILKLNFPTKIIIIGVQLIINERLDAPISI